MRLSSRRWLRSTACLICLLAAAPAYSSSYDLRLPSLGSGLSSRGSPALSAQRGVMVPAPSRPLGLLNLTDLALRNNPQTRAAWAQVKADAASLGIAKAAYWPHVTGTFSATRSQIITSAGFSVRPQTRFGPALSLSYLLWDFGARSGTRDAARYTLLGARLARNQTMQDVVLQVEQAYYGVQGYAALVQADQQSLKNAQANLAAAEKRREQGLSTIGDVYQARAAAAQARLALEQSRGNLAAERGALAEAVGYPANTELRLVKWDEKAVSLPKVSVAELLAQARSARPELLQAKAAELASLAQIRATRGDGLPSITLNGGMGATDVSTVPGINADYSIGATLSIPIFAGFADTYALQRARAQADLNRADTDLLLRQVELQVWQAYQNVKTAATTLKTAKTLVENAVLAQRVSQARYEHGLDTVLNVLTAQATLAAARAANVQDLVNYYSALAVLGHAVGGLTGGRDGRS